MCYVMMVSGGFVSTVPTDDADFELLRSPGLGKEKLIFWHVQVL